MSWKKEEEDVESGQRLESEVVDRRRDKRCAASSGSALPPRSSLNGREPDKDLYVSSRRAHLEENAFQGRLLASSTATSRWIEGRSGQVKKSYNGYN
jgi:hypothetical protein